MMHSSLAVARAGHEEPPASMVEEPVHGIAVLTLAGRLHETGTCHSHN
jgi:hypothetical protein